MNTQVSKTSTIASLGLLANIPNPTPLDKNGVISFSDDQIKDKCLIFQRKYSPLKGQRLCGLAVLPNRSNVELNIYENGSASFNGTSTCSSPTCVCCYASSRREHTEIVENTLKGNCGGFWCSFSDLYDEANQSSKADGTFPGSLEVKQV